MNEIEETRRRERATADVGVLPPREVESRPSP